MSEDPKEKAQKELIHAINNINDRISPLLIPDCGLKIAYALPGARIPSQVMCCVLPKDTKKWAMDELSVSFGRDWQIVNMIITAMRFSPDIRCACEICFSEKLVDICEEMLLETCMCDGKKIPPGVSTMDWTVAFCNDEESGIPDMICIKNRENIPSAAYHFGENPVRITTNLLKISQRIIDATH